MHRLPGEQATLELAPAASSALDPPALETLLQTVAAQQRQIAELTALVADLARHGHAAAA